VCGTYLLREREFLPIYVTKKRVVVVSMDAELFEMAPRTQTLAEVVNRPAYASSNEE